MEQSTEVTEMRTGGGRKKPKRITEICHTTAP